MYIYKYDMSYNVNLVPNIAPQGTVMQYTGVTDPSGWVICDGQARSNASGFYNNILTSQLVNVPNANTTLFTAPFNATASLPDGGARGMRVATSSDGKVIVFNVYNNSGIWISNNYGLGWKKYSETYTNWGVAVSNSGSVIAWTNGPVGNIRMSTNYGNTINTVSIPGFAGETSGQPNIVISGDGTKLLVPSSAGSLYYSSNTGNNWSVVYTNAGFQAICMSNDGNIFAFTQGNFAVYLSTNSGVNWTTILPSGNATNPNTNIATMAMSSNGQYIVLGGTSSSVYLSSSTGTYWTNIGGAGYGTLTTTNKRWSSFSMTPSGQNMILFNNDSVVFASSNYGIWWSSPTFAGLSVADYYSFGCMIQSGLAFFCCYFIDPYISTNYGYNWSKYSTTTTSPNFMPLTSTGFGAPDSIGFSNALAISQTGNIIASACKSGGVFISTNSGNNWLKTFGGSLSTSYGSNAVAMTLTGSSIITTSNNLLHITTNYGANWSALPIPATSRQYWSCAISGNGSVIAANVTDNTGNILLSIDGGSTFTYYAGPTNGLTTQYMGSLAMSSNGSTILMPSNVSTNGGASWSNTTWNSAQIKALAISNDGTKMLASDNSSAALYLSTNSGKNWTTNPGGIGNTGYAPTMSGDGKIMAVCANSTSLLYISTNTGASWVNLMNYINVPTYITSIALSNDGSKLVVARNNGDIFVSNQAFSSSTYYSNFTPLNITNATSTDGTTLKYIMKY